MAPSYGDTVCRALFIFLFLSSLIYHTCGWITYEGEELLALRTSSGELSYDAFLRLNLIEELLADSSHSSNADHGPTSNTKHRRRGRKRGKRGGVLTRLRKRHNQPPLPSIFLANARSVRHKVDELQCLMRTKKDFRDCSLYCITETWLDESVPDSAIITPGFTLYRSDREFNSVDKHRGGGVCFLVNDSWCTNVKVLSKSCTPELETLVIKCRPFYLPREFTSLILTAVYIPPDANAKSAVDHCLKLSPVMKKQIQERFPLWQETLTIQTYGGIYPSTTSM